MKKMSIPVIVAMSFGLSYWTIDGGWTQYLITAGLTALAMFLLNRGSHALVDKYKKSCKCKNK